MTDKETRLLTELRSLNVWDKNASFEVHLDNEGDIVKIDFHQHKKVSKRFSTASEVSSLTN